MNRISIFIVDDHKPMRTLFKAMLNSEKMIRVVGEESKGDDAVKQVIALNPDILLIDQNLLGLSGIDTIKQIKCKKECTTKSILMTMGDLLLYKKDCESIGVDGVMSKSNSKEEIIKIIKRVAQGKSHYD